MDLAKQNDGGDQAIWAHDKRVGLLLAITWHLLIVWNAYLNYHHLPATTTATTPTYN